MSKPVKKPPSFDSDSSFKPWLSTIVDLAKNRSDSVAITAIVGLVFCFIVLMLVGGYVVYLTNQNSIPKPESKTLLK